MSADNEDIKSTSPVSEGKPDLPVAVPVPDAIEAALAMNVPYAALYDQVLIKPLKPEEIKNGIIIPDSAKERAQAGIVLATGPGVMTPVGFISVDVWRGDVVLFGKYAGFEVGVEKLSQIAGGEIVSDVEDLITLRAQEVRLVRLPRPPKPGSPSDPERRAAFEGSEL